MGAVQGQEKSPEDDKYATTVDFYLHGHDRENTGIWDLPVELILMIAKEFDNRTLCRFAATSQRHWAIFRSTCHENALRGEDLVKAELHFGNIEMSLFNKAVKNGNQAAVRSFLEHGLSPDSNYTLFPYSKVSRSALNEAMYLRDSSMCELLLSYGADPLLEKPGMVGYEPEMAPIKQAARQGHSPLVCLFLDYCTKILPGDQIYYDIFLRCDVTAVSHIIKNGFDLQDQSNRSRGYFHYAAANLNGRGVLDYLATVCAEGLARQINGYYGHGIQSLLGWAIRFRQQRNVPAVLEYGADPNMSLSLNGEDSSPLILACSSKQETVVSALIQAGADVNFRQGDGSQAIHFAVKQSARMTEMLLRAGADVRSVTRNGSTPLHLACRLVRMPIVPTIGGQVHINNMPYLDIVELLLGWGAPIDAVNCDGLTPIDEAKDSGRHDLILAMMRNQNIW